MSSTPTPRRTPPNSSPAYYLGQPATFWITTTRHWSTGLRPLGHFHVDRQADQVNRLTRQTDTVVDLLTATGGLWLSY